MDFLGRRASGAATVLLLMCTTQVVAQAIAGAIEETTIRKRVDEVNLTFTVTDGRGRFVTGLTRENFSILDNQRPPASVHSFQSLTELPLRICVLIDASDSITNFLKFQQEVAIGFLKRILRPGVDQACLIKFAAKPVLVEGFTSNVALLESGVRQVRVQGATAVWDAVRFASEVISKDRTEGDIRRAIVLITDGEDNSSHATFEAAQEALMRAGIAVEVVNTIPPSMLLEPVIMSANGQKIKRLASMSGGTVWSGGNPKQLAKALAKIEQSLRSQYFVAYRPSGELSPGQFRKIQMKMRGRRGKIAYRSGYYVAPAD